MKKQETNKKLLFFEILFYSISAICFFIMFILENIPHFISDVIYISFITISFGYLFCLEFLFKKYDNAVHFKMLEKYYIPQKNNKEKPFFKRKGLI